MSGKKKPEPKAQQEPPAEQPLGYAAEDIPPGGYGEITQDPPEPVRPMAVQPPALEDRVAALEKAMIKVDEFCTRHNRYHFGGVTG